MSSTERSTTYIKWTPAGGSEVTNTIVVNATSDAQLVTTLDVPDAATMGTDIEIPFGSIDSLQIIKIRNRTGQALEVTFNGAEASAFNLSASESTLTIEAAEGPASDNITAITLTTTASQSGTGYVDVWLFGDPPAP
jgi:hypothetical protein